MFTTKQPMKLMHSMACMVFVLLLLFPFQLYGDEVDALKKELEEVKEEFVRLYEVENLSDSVQEETRHGGCAQCSGC